MDKSTNKITRITAVQILPVLKRLMWIFPIDSYAPVNLFLLFVTCIKDCTKFIILPYPPFFKENLYFLKNCESNGIAPVSLYALRHTFVSVVKTLLEGEVKGLVGHSKSMDTFGTYGHEIKGEGIATAQNVNEIFTDLLKSVL